MKNTEKRKEIYDFLKTDYDEELSDRKLLKRLRKNISNGKINGKVNSHDNTAKGALLLADLAENFYLETRSEVEQKDRIIKHKQDRLYSKHEEKLREKKDAFKKNVKPKIHWLFYSFIGLVIAASLVFSARELIKDMGNSDFAKIAFLGALVFLAVCVYVAIAILSSQLKKGLADKVCSHEFSRQLATEPEEFSDKESTEYIEKQLNKDEGFVYYLKKNVFSLYNSGTLAQLNDIFTEKLMSEHIIRPIYKKANTRKFRLCSFDENDDTLTR